MLNLDLLQAGATDEAQNVLAEADALLANLSKQKLSRQRLMLALTQLAALAAPLLPTSCCAAMFQAVPSYQ